MKRHEWRGRDEKSEECLKAKGANPSDQNERIKDHGKRKQNRWGREGGH